MVSRYDELGGAPMVGLVYGWYQVVDAEGVPTGRVEAYDAEGDVWERFATANPVGMSATLVPTAVFGAVGGFEVNREEFPIDVEDWDLWIRIAATLSGRAGAATCCITTVATTRTPPLRSIPWTPPTVACWREPLMVSLLTASRCARAQSRVSR